MPMQKQKSQQVVTKLQEFCSTPFEEVLQSHTQALAEDNAVELFHAAVAAVPAYRDFLRSHDIDPLSVDTFADFNRLPLITKENYLRHYPLAELCRNGQLESCDMIAVSSGSTGQPTFWPRFVTDELSIATRFEQIFHDSFQANERSTLAVICFAMGSWVGGVYTMNCCRHLAGKGYPITTIAPGNKIDEILRVVRELGPHFEQVVLLGYPPFLKEVIDTGRAAGVEWQHYGIKLVMAGEVFSEEWRTLVGERTGSQNPCYDSASLYGTADAGVLGNETPLSICIRRFLAEHPDAARALFGESRLPTLVQYDPLSRFFQTQIHPEGSPTLLFSGDNGIPLVRYHISDTGNIIPFDEMFQFLAQWDFYPLEQLGDEARGIYPLPFVYVFGRSHFTVSYFGANIYPENISVGLEQPEIKEWVTGKFVLQVQEDADRNRHLTVAVELAPNTTADTTKREAIATSIQTHLRRLNSEFANYVPEEYQVPQVELAPTGDAAYFPVGVKHRYTRA
ncbi:MAG: phenylacetate--CoA ligase family protein [Abitibacteriaceae bacterium]|nr:phenylacetate--CoA ligase family protein [Abditibacteriaceae bacterium]